MDRTPPKKMADQLTKILKKQKPDPNYLKKVFEYVRSGLEMTGHVKKPRKLPDLLTEEELTAFYEAVWDRADRMHMILIKVLLYTGMRNAELARLKLTDVDVKGAKIRIQDGKGGQDRYVPIPETFKGELAQYASIQKEKGKTYLFESRFNDKFCTRRISEILKFYARKAGIEKRIYPHLFRHQILTYLTQKGIVDAKIQLISGHKNRKSLMIYQDLSLADVTDEYNEAMKDFPVK